MIRSKLSLLDFLTFLNNIIVSMKCGKRAVPVEKLKILADIYETSIDYIVELTDEPKAYPRSKNNPFNNDDKGTN